MEPTTGRVVPDGIDATDTIGRVGYMLQKDLLLSWRTVVDNVFLGMRSRASPCATRVPGHCRCCSAMDLLASSSFI